ncbi:MAG: carbonic anhydrase [Geminicoccaceae bacterium]
MHDSSTDIQAVDSQQGFPTKLLDGYRLFKQGRFEDERERYRDLAERGQTPETLIIACCDSRAAPETIFNTLPGELFVVRNVANLVPPYEPDGHYHSTSAALEFAVQSLKVKHIVVLGHGRCGGIKAALDPADEPLSPGDFIGKWMQLLEEAAGHVAANSWMTSAERQTALERISIRHTLANLRTFPCVDILEKKGRLSLSGAWFDIAEGELWIMDPDSGDFSRAG